MSSPWIASVLFGVRLAWCSSTPTQLMSGSIGGASSTEPLWRRVAASDHGRRPCDPAGRVAGEVRRLSADLCERRVRVDGRAAPGVDLEMQVRPGRVARRAHPADDLARAHVARGPYVLGQVVV